ncbi:MAG: DUF1513 domain-containing protein [Stappiaceae bacterium]
MRLMEIDRRSFVAGVGGVFLSGLGSHRAEAATHGDVLFAAPRREPDGSFAISIFNQDGDIVLSEPLPDRGHDVAICEQKGHFVTFARRAGFFALVLDVFQRNEPILLKASEGRHFYGHGVYSPDGDLLYATEQDYETARGVLGIYDASDGYNRIGEISTHGVGPHDLVLTPDGTTLVVANGGIKTHPDTGRDKLNLSTMQPNMALIDRVSGSLIRRLSLPKESHQLSIRHLDIDNAGTVWFGCQHQGELSEAPSLVGHLKRDEELQLLSMPPSVSMRMENYVGSVAVNNKTGVVATSGPRGGLVLFWDSNSGALINEHVLSDGCGLAATEEGFIASNGRGRLVSADPNRLVAKNLARFAGVAWDNHIARTAKPLTIRK